MGPHTSISKMSMSYQSEHRIAKQGCVHACLLRVHGTTQIVVCSHVTGYPLVSVALHAA
eukprot:COSAG01_NODE_3951_length_5501_cov_3.287116_6_plen_59_part_00